MRKVLDKRKILIVAGLAILFTAMQIVGYQISMIYKTSVHQSHFFQNIGILSTAQVAVVVLVEIPFWYVLLYGLFSFFTKIKPCEVQCSSKYGFVLWMILTGLLMLCWLPCFLAGYPGFYNYDAFSQVPQALYEEVPYSAHHPLVHTLLMGKIISAGYHLSGELNVGIALYSIFQMCFCAMVFAGLLCYIRKITGRRRLLILSFGYYGFLPIIAMFAMSTTKDVIFSILLQLCAVFVYEIFQDLEHFWNSKKWIVSFLILLVGMCLFRKNGIYIIVGMIPFMIMFERIQWKRCLLLFLAVISIYFVTDKSLMLVLDAEKGSPEEALSVPMQQLAKVYYEYGESAFEEKELELIYKGISVDRLEEYNPFLSDNIKNNFDYKVVEGNAGDYIMLWLQKGLQYPALYIRAFLDNTYQAWYPGTSVYDEPDGERTYYFDMSMHPGGERESKAPGLLGFYEEIAGGFWYQRFPVVRLFFSIGAMFWVALFTFAFAVYQKNRPLIMAIVMSLLCCVTVFLGPVSLVRYYLVLFYGLPVNIAFLVDKRSVLNS